MNQEMRDEARRAAEQQYGVLTYSVVDPETHQEQSVEKQIIPPFERQLAEQGIELRSDTRRFIELFADLNFVTGDLETADQSLQEARSHHEQLKEQIRQKFTGGKRTQQMGLEGQRWSTQQAELAQAVEQGQQLHNRVIDAFIQEFVLSGGGLSRLPLLMEEVSESGLVPTTHLQLLLEQITARVVTIEQTRISSFSYKTESANLRTPAQSLVLCDLLRCAYSETDQPALTHIARGLLRTMANQAGSLYGQAEQTPLSAFAYDVLFAAQQVVDESVFKQALEWMVEWLDGREQKNGAFSQELAILGDRADQEMGEMQEKVLGNLEELEISDLADEQLLDRYSPLNPDTPYTVGTHYERYNGLEVALGLAPLLLPPKKGQPRPNLINKNRQKALDKSQRMRAIRAAGSTQQQHMIAEIQARNTFATHWRSLIGNHFPEATTLDNLCSVLLPKAAYLESKSELVETVGRPQKKNSLSLMSDVDTAVESLAKLPKSVDSLVTQTQTLALFIDQPELSQAEIAAESMRYLEQVRQIFDENEWMVADCGDRFLAEHDDLELQQLGIEHLTFYPTTPEQRDVIGGVFAYRVELRLNKPQTERGKQLSLLVDREGKLYLPKGGPLVIPLWLETPLRGLVADRLLFITQGFGEQEKEPEVVDAEPADKEKEQVQRRAHWRKLKGDRYSLRTPSAKAHAQAVLNDPRYGIDIMERNTRGHSSGRLQQNEWETFVMATVRGEMAPRIQRYSSRLDSPVPQ